jgi:hypothetical protein
VKRGGRSWPGNLKSRHRRFPRGIQRRDSLSRRIKLTRQHLRLRRISLLATYLLVECAARRSQGRCRRRLLNGERRGLVFGAVAQRIERRQSTALVSFSFEVWEPQLRRVQLALDYRGPHNFTAFRSRTARPRTTLYAAKERDEFVVGGCLSEGLTMNLPRKILRLDRNSSSPE